MSILPSFPQSEKNIELPMGARLTESRDTTEELIKVTEGVYAYVKGTIKTHLVIPTEKRVVGKGAEGSVYQSEIYDDLVVKKFNHQELSEVKEELKRGRELNHPNLNKSHVLIIKHYDDSFKMKLIMDKAEGKTLFSMIANGEEYEAVHTKKILTQLKSVFIYLINENYYWADLNRGNIFLSENGSLKVVDFGAWGEHSRFSKRSLLYSQLDEAINTFSTLISLSNAGNKQEVLDALKEKKETWLSEVRVGGIRNPEEYLKGKIEELFTLTVEKT